MTRRIDVSGPINRVLREAERKFDAAIYELSTVEAKLALMEQARERALRESPMHALGQLAASFREDIIRMAAAFQLGQRDYTRGS